MLRCFVDPKNFSFIKHWNKNNAELAAKITSNVIGRYRTLSCEEKVSFALEAVFECYLKFQTALLPEKINFYIRTKIRDHIREEITYSKKQAEFAKSGGWIEENMEEEKRETIADLIDLAKDTFCESDYLLFYAYWIEGENINAAERVKACCLVKKLKERYETLDISRINVKIKKTYISSVASTAHRIKKTTSGQMYWSFK